MKIFVRLSILIFTCHVLCTSGCSFGPKKPEGMPKLCPTEVTVSSDSGPVADAIVSLIPADGTRAKWGSGGKTNSNGVAKIKTHGQFDGVPVGKYKITVKKTETQGDTPPPMGTDAKSQQVYDEYMKSGSKQRFFSVIDDKFSTAKSTDLEMEVTDQKLSTASVNVGGLVQNEMISSSATAN